MSGVDRYRELLDRPHARAFVAWSLLGRLPLGMTALALLFLLRGEGYSYGAAGIGVAGYTVAVGIGAPIAGRRVDRVGPARVLGARAVLYAVFAAAIVALALLDAGLAPITLAAVACGLSMPPLSATVRIVWPRFAPSELRSTAYALEAALQEIFFLGGPLLAAGLAALDPVAGVAGAGVACFAGTLATARLPPVRETPASRHEGAGLLGALTRRGSGRSSSTPLRWERASARSSSRCRRSPRRTARASSAGWRSRASPPAASREACSRGRDPNGTTCAASRSARSESPSACSASSSRSRSRASACSRSSPASRSRRRSPSSTR